VYALGGEFFDELSVRQRFFTACAVFDKLAQRVVAEFPECRTLDKAIDEAA